LFVLGIFDYIMPRYNIDKINFKC